MTRTANLVLLSSLLLFSGCSARIPTLLERPDTGFTFTLPSEFEVAPSETVSEEETTWIVTSNKLLVARAHIQARQLSGRAKLQLQDLEEYVENYVKFLKQASTAKYRGVEVLSHRVFEVDGATAGEVIFTGADVLDGMRHRRTLFLKDPNREDCWVEVKLSVALHKKNELMPKLDRIIDTWKWSK